MTEQNHNPEREQIEETEDPQIMELVAYLDGELPEQDADRVERMLQANAPLRRNAETLDRTWRMLDALGEPTASGDFTQKTLISISTLPAESDARRATSLRQVMREILPRSVIVRGLIWCLAGFFACSAGLLLSRNARRERTDPGDAQLLKDLDLYRQYPKLWHIPDVEFLKEISADSESSSVTGEQP
jgi:anti-sigma factor RsiW